jgi:iron-sulfur cluster assembly accessory protein
MEEHMLSFTDEALTKAIELRNQSGGAGLVLRVSVQPGGCAGLRYRLDFDPNRLPDDELVVHTAPSGAELTVVVDRPSAPYLSEATLDYVDELNRSGFVFDNPASSGGCSCGDSFN